MHSSCLMDVQSLQFRVTPELLETVDLVLKGNSVLVLEDNAFNNVPPQPQRWIADILQAWLLSTVNATTANFQCPIDVFFTSNWETCRLTGAQAGPASRQSEGSEAGAKPS